MELSQYLFVIGISVRILVLRTWGKRQADEASEATDDELLETSRDARTEWIDVQLFVA